MVLKKRVKLKATGRWRMNGQTTNQPSTRAGGCHFTPYKSEVTGLPLQQRIGVF